MVQKVLGVTLVAGEQAAESCSFRGQRYRSSGRPTGRRLRRLGATNAMPRAAKSALNNQFRDPFGQGGLDVPHGLSSSGGGSRPSILQVTSPAFSVKRL